MLVKANLINGESKIVAIEGNSFDEISGILLDKTFKWYNVVMNTPYEITCMNIPEKFLKCNEISKIESLTLEEEIKIQEKINPCKGNDLLITFLKHINKGVLSEMKNNIEFESPQGEPPRESIKTPYSPTYSINDLIVLKDRDIITQEEFKILARKMVGL